MIMPRVFETRQRGVAIVFELAGQAASKGAWIGLMNVPGWVLRSCGAHDAAQGVCRSVCAVCAVCASVACVCMWRVCCDLGLGVRTGAARRLKGVESLSHVQSTRARPEPSKSKLNFYITLALYGYLYPVWGR